MNTFIALTFVLLVASIPYSYAHDDDDSTETDDDSTETDDDVADQMYDKMSKYENCNYIGASRARGVFSVMKYGCLHEKKHFKRSFKRFNCRFLKFKVTYCNARFARYSTYATACQFAKEAFSLCICTNQKRKMLRLGLSCDDYEEDCTQYRKPWYGCRFSRWNKSKRCTCEKNQKSLSCCKPLPTTTESAEPTTVAATTQAPTTAAPTTQAPTTAAPTTQAPTTQAPTTQAPTTQAPTTQAPTTQAPTTAAPTTQAPTTAAPTTQAPTTAAPTTQAPTTASPTTQAPTTASSLPISIVPGFLDGSGCGALCVRNDAVDTECQTAPTGPCNYGGELAGQYSCCEP